MTNRIKAEDGRARLFESRENAQQQRFESEANESGRTGEERGHKYILPPQLSLVQAHHST
jgi:hypothetical protein